MKKIIAITVFLLLIITLCACDSGTLPTPTAEQKLEYLTEKFSETEVMEVHGKIYRDGILYSEIDGVFDDANKRVKMTLDGVEYLYFSRFLLSKGDGGYAVGKVNTSFAETTKLLPFSLYDFTYSAKNRKDITMSDSHIYISFLDRGVKNTFSSSLDVSGGVFSIAHDEKRITDTVLTTNLTENGKTVSYSLHYSYGYGAAETAFDDIPFVAPANTINYTVYAVTTMASVHSGETLRDKSTGFNINAGIDVFILDRDEIINFFVITADDSYELNIVYADNYVIPILGGTKEVKITYDKDFRVSLVRVGSNRFELR